MAARSTWAIRITFLTVSFVAGSVRRKRWQSFGEWRPPAQRRPGGFSRAAGLPPFAFYVWPTLPQTPVAHEQTVLHHDRNLLRERPASPGARLRDGHHGRDRAGAAQPRRGG